MVANAKRLYRKVANEIIEQINAGVYQLGACIPAERKLAEQFGVSRTVIREAMVYLDMLGIADIRKGSGVFIVRRVAKLSIDSKTAHVTPFEILQARLMFEPQLARYAAQNPTPELITELSNCIKMMESSRYFSEQSLRKQASVDADRQFHTIINSAANNPLLIRFHNELMQLHLTPEMSALMDELADQSALHGQWLDDHKNVFAAIKEGDGDKAEQCMYDHITRVISEITE